MLASVLGLIFVIVLTAGVYLVFFDAGNQHVGGLYKMTPEDTRSEGQELVTAAAAAGEEEGGGGYSVVVNLESQEVDWKGAGIGFLRRFRQTCRTLFFFGDRSAHLSAIFRVVRSLQ